MENEENQAEFDVNALLASINSNLEEGLLSNQNDNTNENQSNSLNNSPSKQESSFQEKSSPQKQEENNNETNKSEEEKKQTNTGQIKQKSNIFTVVRDKPEENDEIDPLIKTLEKIKIVKIIF